MHASPVSSTVSPEVLSCSRLASISRVTGREDHTTQAYPLRFSSALVCMVSQVLRSACTESNTTCEMHDKTNNNSNNEQLTCVRSATSTSFAALSPSPLFMMLWILASSSLEGLMMRGSSTSIAKGRPLPEYTQ